MTEYPYEPPEREFTDTMLAFRDLQMTSTWRALVEPDPLGDVNKIVTLMRGNHRVKSVLARVPVGATVKLGHDQGAPRIRFWGPTWQELAGADAPIQVEPYRAPSWYVEIDDRRVIDVPEHETYPPTRPTPPPVPLKLRARRAIRKRWRATTDTIARRFGYHHEDDCGGWDE